MLQVEIEGMRFDFVVLLLQALGSLYLFHKRVEAVYMWNFRSKKQFVENGRQGGKEERMEA